MKHYAPHGHFQGQQQLSTAKFYFSLAPLWGSLFTLHFTHFMVVVTKRVRSYNYNFLKLPTFTHLQDDKKLVF
jgi:hypothetical protein